MQKFSSIWATTASASAMSELFGLGQPQLPSPLVLMPAQGAPLSCPLGATKIVVLSESGCRP
jgi:hypothetical protein